MSAPIDLAHDPVEFLIRQTGWDEILIALRGVSQWTDDIARKLDVYFLHHTIRLLRVSSSNATLLDFGEHLARAAHPRRREKLNALDKPYAERWLAWRDLVDARAEAMAAPVGAAVKNRTHLMKVIELLAGNNSEMQQNEIGATLNLKGPNLTRIMNLLEGAEMIERNKHGREKIVKLTAAGGALVGKEIPDGVGSNAQVDTAALPHVGRVSTRHVGLKPDLQNVPIVAHQSPHTRSGNNMLAMKKAA